MACIENENDKTVQCTIEQDGQSWNTTKKPKEEHIYLNQIVSFANTGVTRWLRPDPRNSYVEHWHCNFTNEETNSEMSHNSINRDRKHRFGGRNS